MTAKIISKKLYKNRIRTSLIDVVVGLQSLELFSIRYFRMLDNKGSEILHRPFSLKLEFNVLLTIRFS